MVIDWNPFKKHFKLTAIRPAFDFQISIFSNVNRICRLFIGSSPFEKWIIYRLESLKKRKIIYSLEIL
jgi:hypothetical protein